MSAAKMQDLAAGNRVIIKPSELAPRTSDLLYEMLHSLFDPTTVSVIKGGPEVAARFSSLPFNHLFFTGSTAVGKKVAGAAAENLTPLTLELGGKSPVVIDNSADLAIFEYINGFYNPRRRHSALGWKSPLAFEQKAA